MVLLRAGALPVDADLVGAPPSSPPLGLLMTLRVVFDRIRGAVPSSSVPNSGFRDACNANNEMKFTWGCAGVTASKTGLAVNENTGRGDTLLQPVDTGKPDSRVS
jgi:hypothetical protein